MISKKLNKCLIVCILLFLIIKSSGQNIIKIRQVENKYKWIHSFGVSMNNNIYFPEKVYNNYGLITQKPAVRYGYEFDINYSPIIYKGFGMNIDVILFGSIPDGHNLTSHKTIPQDTVWFNGAKGDPTDLAPDNGSGLNYWGLNIMFNYTFNPTKHLLLQPTAGFKLPFMPTYRSTATAAFCDSTQGNCVYYFYGTADNLQNKRVFFPDLLVGINFLIYLKNPMHCIRAGIMFDYGFVPRAQGYYEVRNLGSKYNSGGNVKYGSSHLSVTIGYQFFGDKKTRIKTGKKEAPQEKF